MRPTASEEVDYKLNLILITFLRGVKKYGYSFSISANKDCDNKFNDLSLVYTNTANETNLRSLQVVYESEESKTLTYNSLFNSTKFNIDIYFNAFRAQFENLQFQNNYFILFTNSNIDDNLLPYFSEVGIGEADSILNFPETKVNGTHPQYYKLNAKFIEAFNQNRKLMLANDLLDYCLGNKKLRITNDNLFKEYHLILLVEVIDSKKNCFRRNFVERQNLSGVTLLFREIFDQQLEKRHLPNTSIEERDVWLSTLRVCVSSHFGKIPTSKGLPHIHFEDEDWLFRIFCSQLIIALKQPNLKKLEGLIKSECQSLVGRGSSKYLATLLMDELQFRLHSWFGATNTKTKQLNIKFFNDIFKYIKDNNAEAIAANSSRKQIADLRSLNNVEFRNIHYAHALKRFLIDKDKKCLLINTLGLSGVSLLKLFKCLEKRLFLFTTKTSIIEIAKLQELIISSEEYHILVWEISIAANDNVLKSFLMQIIPNIKKKKLIIVNNNRDSATFKLVGSQISFIDDHTTFGELTEDTQKRLLQKFVFFQNDLIEFGTMFSIPLSHVETESWCSLLRDNASIGRKVNISDDYNSAYYINRSIKREKPIEEFDESSFMNLRVLGSTIQSSDVDCHHKVFIIADQAGMGKSIFSSHLAREIKIVRPHFWVVRLVAMECVQNLTWLTTTLQANRKVGEDVLLSDFVMGRLLKLVTPIERFIFGQFLKDDIVPNKLVFLFDGYDEIDVKCQKMIIRVLKYLSTKPNVISIGITTRPQFKERLELEFQQNSYVLEAFTERNKLDFLKKFWSFKDETKKLIALELFAERLLAGISKSLTEKDTQLTGIPLQMRMIGEIFKSEAIKFEGQIDKRATEPVAVGLYNLYEMFIKNKENIFITEKIGAVTTQLDPHVLRTVKEHQSRYARHIILGDTEDDCIVNADDLAQTISLGIIQRNQGGFFFIHRTFAEFLTAKFLLDEYILNEAASVTDIITKGFFIERIRDTSLNVVRKFINCELHHEDLVRKFKASGCEAEIRELMSKTFQEIAYYLVEEENFEILRFILEIFLWLEPQKMESFIIAFVFTAYDLTKKGLATTVILDWMMAKWRDVENGILLHTLHYLLLIILRSGFQGGKKNYELVKCVINFQDELESLQVLSKMQLTYILSLIDLETTDESVRYWSRFSIDYLVHLHQKHRDVFYDFLKQRPELAAIMLAACTLGGILMKFLNIFRNDETIDGDTVYDILVEGDMQRFNLWNKKNFHEYFQALSVHASKFSAASNEKFQVKLAEFIPMLSSRFDMTIEYACSTFFVNYSKFVPLQKIMLQFHKANTLSDLEHYALWSQTNKLRSILTCGFIEKKAEMDLKFTRRDKWLDKRQKILNNFRKRHTNEEFIEKVSAKNLQNDTILVHAIQRNDRYNIEFFSSWITSEEIFLRMMNVVGKMFTFHISFDVFVCFVENKFPQYLVRFLEVHKNEFIYWGHSSEEIFRILAGDTVGEEDFVKLLSMNKDIEWLGNESLVHHIIGWWCKTEIMAQWLNLMKRKCKNTENIVKLFRLKRKDDESPIDIIRWDVNLMDRKERYKLLLNFFTDLGLIALKEEVEPLMRFRKGVYESDDEEEGTGSEEETDEPEIAEVIKITDTDYNEEVNSESGKRFPDREAN